MILTDEKSEKKIRKKEEMRRNRNSIKRERKQR